VALGAVSPPCVSSGALGPKSSKIPICRERWRAVPMLGATVSMPLERGGATALLTRLSGFPTDHLFTLGLTVGLERRF
jgi:hypothetical protein